MASGPITSWQIDGENNGNSVRLYFLVSKTTADGDCNHESKRCLLLGRKVMTNLDSILKSRDITLPTKFRLIKAVYCHLVYLNCMQSTSGETLGWMKLKLESRLLGNISITSDMQMTPPLWQKVKKNKRAS